MLILYRQSQRLIHLNLMVASIGMFITNPNSSNSSKHEEFIGAAVGTQSADVTYFSLD